MGLKGVILIPPARPSPARPSWGTATALQAVANRPLLCHALDALAAADVAEVLVVGPAALSAEVAACVEHDGPPSVAIAYQASSSEAGPGAGTLAAIDWVDGAACIVHRADGLMTEPLAPYAEILKSRAADLLLLVHHRASEHDRLDGTARRLLRIAEFNPAQTALGIAGIGLLGPGALRRAGHGAGGVEADFDLTTLADRVAESGGRVEAQVARRWHRYAGDAADLLDLNREMLDTLRLDEDPVATADNQIEGRVWIHETARVTASVIVGPAIIGARSRVIDAYVGPYTSVGADVRIEGAEVERSIISAGASIMHVGGRLVACVVGSNARIFRDFSLPRAMRLRVGDGVEVALC